VSPDDIKEVRKKLACTAKELAGALGVEQSTVLAWEKATLFPTKIYVDRMTELLAKGPSAIPRKAIKPKEQVRDGTSLGLTTPPSSERRHVAGSAGAWSTPDGRNDGGSDPLRALADPQVWELVRKIAANKKFRDEVAKLAEGYPDPATE
jgi:transcriptional regulator with XRE-family HTH domain